MSSASLASPESEESFQANLSERNYRKKKFSEGLAGSSITPHGPFQNFIFSIESRIMLKSRGYCFTINNYTDVILSQLMELFETGVATYLVVGFEVAPETGTRHIQGYMHFGNPRSMSGIHKLVSNMHLEAPRATGAKYTLRYLYCMKGDQPKEEWESMSDKGPNFGRNSDFIEYGVRPQDGISKVTTLITTAILNGSTYEDVFAEYPQYCLQHSRNVKAFITDASVYKQPQLFTIKETPTLHGDIDHNFPDRRIHWVDIDNFYELEVEGDTSQDVVVALVGLPNRTYQLWGYGKPITYKYGYECKKLRCAQLVLVSPRDPTKEFCYNMYKNLTPGEYLKN
nr:putative replication associated protein [Crucivirus sp.]